jgi:hypothetical protein
VEFEAVVAVSSCSSNLFAFPLEGVVEVEELLVVAALQLALPPVLMPMMRRGFFEVAVGQLAYVEVAGAIAG